MGSGVDLQRTGLATRARLAAYDDLIFDASNSGDLARNLQRFRPLKGGIGETRKGHLAIARLDRNDVVADGLAFVLDHQAGAIESLDLRELVISATTKAVRQTGEAKIANPYGASVK